MKSINYRDECPACSNSTSGITQPVCECMGIFVREKITKELIENGWKRTGHSVWESPSGEFFRGPYGAYWAMLEDAKTNTET